MKVKCLGPNETTRSRTMREIIKTWGRTFVGYAVMVTLTSIPFVVFHAPLKVLLGWNILWYVLPIVTWWFSAEISLKLQKCVPADPSNPVHKQLIDIIDELFPLTGLKYKPPVYIAATKSPNAFATGPIHRKAVVAATEGLFLIPNFTRNHIKAVFAHEMSHVFNYDVAINSLIAVMSQMFFVASNSIVEGWVKSIKIFRRAVGLKPKHGFGVETIASSIIFYAIFWVTGQMTKIIQMFVVRSRESGADARGALMTGRPCDLAIALEKLVEYVETHRPVGVEKEMFRAMRTMYTIDPLFDSTSRDAKPKTWFEHIKAFWKNLQLTHPPIPDRVAVLERINGGVCPR
jgi:Zn-dependent protease with chaperone function